MKRITLILFFFFLFPTTLLFSEDKPKEVYLSPDQAGIVEIEGEVTIIKSDDQCFKATEGAVLENGDRLQVGSGASCQVAFGKELEQSVRFEEDSDAGLTPSEDIRIDIAKGRLFAVVRKLGANEKFDIRTPVAVCTVRGTSFEVVVVAEDVDVYTYEGSVAVQSLEDYKKGLAAVSWVNRGKRTRLSRGWSWEALVVADMASATLSNGQSYGAAVWAAVASYSTRRGKKFYEGISYLDPANLHPTSPWKDKESMSEEEKQKQAAGELEEYMKKKRKKQGSWKYNF